MLYHCKCTTSYLSLTNRVQGTPRIQLSLCINNCWQPDFLYRYLGIPKDWRWSMCRNPTQLHVKITSVETLISSCENGENTKATVPRHTARLERVWSAWSMALWANFHWSCTTCRMFLTLSATTLGALPIPTFLRLMPGSLGIHYMLH